jgi:hypothetical protein
MPSVPSATVPASAHAEPSLAHTLLGSHLPRLLATLTPIAVCNLLAAIPAGTGAIGAAVEAITRRSSAARWWAMNAPRPL